MSRSGQPLPYRPTSSKRLDARLSRLSGWLLLVTLTILLAQGSTALHLLLVPHTTCEHGELVEGRSSAREDSRDAVQEPQTRAVQGHGSEASHEHCSVKALRHHPAAVALRIDSAAFVSLATPISLREQPEFRTVPLLLLAPKSSPPTA